MLLSVDGELEAGDSTAVSLRVKRTCAKCYWSAAVVQQTFQRPVLSLALCCVWNVPGEKSLCVLSRS